MLLLGGGCATTSNKPSAQATKRTVAEAEVPPLVMKTWTSAHPSGKTFVWTEKGGVYTVRGQDSGGWLMLSINGDGSLKKTQEQVAEGGAPEPVRSAFQASPYAKMTYVDGLKQVVMGKDPESATLFKFIVKDGDKNLIAVYGPDGKLVKEKSMTPEELASWQAEHKPAT